MNRKLTRTIISLLLVGVAAIIIIFLIMSNKTYYNEGNEIGNTAGNLYNGGIFCEQEDQIYFSNFEDDGALYRMDLNLSNVEKISDDKVCFINADPHYVYYSRINYTKENATQSVFTFYNRGIYRISHDGKNLKLLYKDPSGLLSLYGNKVLYQHYTKQTGTTFYEVGIDAKNEKMLSKEAILPASYYNGSLYYAGVASDHFIHVMNVETKNVSTFYDGNCYMPIATKNGVYYIDLNNNYALCFIDYETKTPTTLVERFCSSYNINFDESTLYYQVDGGDNNRICTYDIASGVTETIIDGNYKNIHVSSNYVFFRDFDETNTYAYNPKTKELKTFIAPVIE